MKKRSICMAAVVASLAMLPALTVEALAQATSPPVLNYLPAGSELAARPPELFTFLSNDYFVAVDPLDSSVVVFRGSGQIVGKSSPLSFFPTSVREYAERLEFVRADNARYAILSRSVTPERIGELAESDAALAPNAANTGMRRRNARSIEIKIRGPQPVTLNVSAVSKGPLASASLLGKDSRGRRFVQVSEIVKTSPNIEVSVSVLRFSAKGRLEEFAPVPLEGIDGLPSRFIALTETGAVTALIPTKTGVTLQRLAFRPVIADKNSAAAPMPVAPTTLDVNVIPQDAGQPDESNQAPPVIRPTTRGEILGRARRFINVSWVLDAGNFLRSGVDNQCAKTEGKFWARPKRLTQAMVGKKINFTPYYWGGNDTPETFLTKISQGALAGSVCTCREQQYNYCQVDYAAGVDCSGFVTRAWGTSKYGTSNLNLIATPITDISKVRPGDAFNKPGSHVRLVVGVSSVPTLRFETLESTTNLRCEGVCSTTYTLEELSGYTPMRFNGVRD